MSGSLVPLSRGRQVAVVAGLFYTVFGIVGFAVSGFDGFARTSGDLLVIIEVNPLQNLIHLILGWVLINAGSAGEVESRRAVYVALLVLLALGLAGPTVFEPRPALNVLSVNRASTVIHLATAAAVAVWLAVPGRRADAGGPPVPGDPVSERDASDPAL